jgi:poly(3-hydroxybutyrate) depolymerase
MIASTIASIAFVMSNIPIDIQQQTIKMDGVDRKYVEIKPKDDWEPHGIFMLFHGSGGTPSEMVGYFQNIIQKKLAQNYIVIAPEGMNKTWNAEHCCGNSYRSKADDVTFIKAIMDQTSKKYPINRDRVFALGHSNGGMFTHRLAAETDNLITGIMDVSGTIGGIPEGERQPILPDPLKKTAILMIHGAKDKEVQANDPNYSAADDRRKDYPFIEGMRYMAEKYKYNEAAPIPSPSRSCTKYLYHNQEDPTDTKEITGILFDNMEHIPSPQEVPEVEKEIEEFMKRQENKIQFDARRDQAG